MLNKSLGSLLAVVCGLVVSPASRAATVNVNLLGFVFSPADVTIQIGDTVHWEWVSGFHDVKSGSAGGVQDNIFDSGIPVAPPASFDLTFDQTFLNANPVAGNAYTYFCSVHVGIGMVGTVTVAGPPPVPIASYWGAASLAVLITIALSVLLWKRRAAG